MSASDWKKWAGKVLHIWWESAEGKPLGKAGWGVWTSRLCGR